MKNLDLFRAQERNEQLVTVCNDRAVTTSLMVAKYFNKRHSDVLRAIRKLDCSGQFQQRNFALCQEIKKLEIGSTRTQYYYLTRDGFTFLAMGFTGKVAAKFKEAYINAFNEMEDKLRKDVSKRTSRSNTADKRKIERFEAEIEQLETRLKMYMAVEKQERELKCSCFHYLVETKQYHKWSEFHKQNK